MSRHIYGSPHTRKVIHKARMQRRASQDFYLFNGYFTNTHGDKQFVVRGYQSRHAGSAASYYKKRGNRITRRAPNLAGKGGAYKKPYCAKWAMW